MKGQGIYFFRWCEHEHYSRCNLNRTKNFEHLGRSVSTAGDVNGDGYSDVVVGTDSDTAYVYFGELTMNNIADVVLTAAAGVFGYAVSNAGDVNGDGYSDLIVGAIIAGANLAGRAYIFFGGSNMNGVSDVTLIGENATIYLVSRFLMPVM